MVLGLVGLVGLALDLSVLLTMMSGTADNDSSLLSLDVADV